MRTQLGARRATVAVIAALVLVTAWAAVGDRALPQVGDRHRTSEISAPERSVTDTLVSVDASHAVVASIQAGSRIAGLRLGPAWSLAGFAAALAALSARRRRLDRLRPAGRPVFRRGSVCRRAPPLASIA